MVTVGDAHLVGKDEEIGPAITVEIVRNEFGAWHGERNIRRRMSREFPC